MGIRVGAARTAAIIGERAGIEVLTMSSQWRWTLFGALIGLAGGGASAGVALAVGPVPGAAVGLAAAKISGIAAARWAGVGTLRLAAEAVASLTPDGTGGEEPAPAPLDRGRFDETIEHLRDELASARRIQ